MKTEIFCTNLQELHRWLLDNHQTASGCWLVYYKGDKRTFTWEELVQELLSFGWIDSKAGKVDADKSKLWISPRKPNSNWSAKNKAHIAQFEQQGRMQPAGKKMVELAKKSGTWTALDTVETLLIPADLDAEFDNHTQARTNFEAFPRSVKRAILEWILKAKRPGTRTKRIQETARLAQENIRANQYQPRRG